MNNDKLTEIIMDIVLSALGLSAMNVILSKYVTWLFDFALMISDKL